MNAVKDARRLLAGIMPVRLWMLPAIYFVMACGVAFPVWWFCSDEGYYSYAARCVIEGQRPYRDFMFAQMPVMPYLYGAWFAIFGTSIESGRLCTIVLTTAGVVLSIAGCYRVGGLWAGLLAGLLWISSPHLVADLILIRTQPICQVLICGTIFCLAVLQQRNDARAAFGAMALMSLAFLTRLTMLVPLAIVWAYVGWKWRHNLGAFAAAAVANVVAIAACIAFLWSDGNFWFGVYETHRTFWGEGPWTWARLGWTVKGWITNQLPIVLCFALAMVRFGWVARDRREWSGLELPAVLLACHWALTLFQWSQVQNYPTHHSVSVAFSIAFSGLVLQPVLEAVARQRLVPVVPFFAATWLICLPFTTAEFNGFGDRAFSFGRQDYIAEALGIIEKYAKPGDQLLSFNVELAVNGNYRMYPGCEQSEWCYMPRVSDEFADRHHLLNAGRLTAAIRDGAAPIITITDRDFMIMAAGERERAETLKKLLDDRYQNVGLVKAYGQFQQNLYIFKNIRPPGDAR